MPSVLVLDDEPALVKLVSAILKSAGYEVHAYTRPTEALEDLPGLQLDAIIADISMPVMTGMDFFHQVRAFERFKYTPFIFLSGLAERRDVREGMALGADDYITKPFESRELLEALAVRLKRAEEARPNATRGSLIQARALGEASVTWAGREVTWGSKKAAEFFFFLLEHPGGTTTWEAAEALWPEKDEARAASVFHTTLHRLRKTLEPEAVNSANRRYYLNPELSIQFDVRQYLDAAKSAQARQDQGLYDTAIRLYRGPYLAGFDSEWCEERRETLHATHLGLLLDAAKLAESRQDTHRAAYYAHLGTQHEPFSDAAWNELSRLWESMGDPRRAARAREHQSHWED
ncbi:MAG TPA: response regulator [Deinococcales bacterium]|nr:response regulator [Deinococcales bacterium]